MRRLPGSTVLCATVLGLAACGGGGDSGGSGGSGDSGGSGGSGAEASSVATARREVAETRTALRAALASYRSGDRAGAQEQVSEAYVSHFEAVEHPLEAEDPALKERLEEAIGTELRTAMKAKAPTAEVTAAVQEVVADLDQAEAALR